MDYTTPLIKIPRPSDANILRKAIVANAKSIIGVSAADKTTRPIFEEILGPNKYPWDLDRPFRAYKSNDKWKTEGVSTCGLVARGLWRRMGVDMPDLYKNYIAGTALSAEESFARKNNAWQTTWTGKELDLRPQIGDYCIIGTGLATHALTVVDWNDNECISVDGGQVGVKGLQCIKQINRAWSQINPSTKKIEPFLGNRKLIGWIIFDLLPFRNNTIIVPEGWDY
jgi:hypothetical protein